MTTELDDAALESIIDEAEEAAEYAGEQAAGEVFLERLTHEQRPIALKRLRTRKNPFYIDPEWPDDLKQAIQDARDYYYSAMRRHFRIRAEEIRRRAQDRRPHLSEAALR